MILSALFEIGVAGEAFPFEMVNMSMKYNSAKFGGGMYLSNDGQHGRGDYNIFGLQALGNTASGAGKQAKSGARC